MKCSGRQSDGFTIVELLIVIVVIAILATITIIAYNGIRDRATMSSLQSKVSQVGKKVLAYAPQNADLFPSESSYAQDISLPVSSTQAVYNYYVSDDQKSFCISVADTTRVPEVAFAMTQKGQVVAGRCIKNWAINPGADVTGTYWSTNTTGTAYSRDTSTFRSGQASMRMTISTSPGEASLQLWDGSTIPLISTTSGDYITISGYVKAANNANSIGKTVNIRHRWRDSGVGQMTSTNGPSIALTTNWQKVTSTASTPSGAAYDHVSFYVNAPVNGTDWSLDDVMVLRGQSPYVFASPYENDSWNWVGAPGVSTSFGPAQQDL